MGRIKTDQVKRVTKELMKVHGTELTEDFEKNQGLVNKFVSVDSKKLRNKIAGYATKLVKKSKEPEEDYSI